MVQVKQCLLVKDRRVVVYGSGEGRHALICGWKGVKVGIN
jgi:hypothetical protein